MILKALYQHIVDRKSLKITHSGVDPGRVLWVLKHPPPSGLRYMYSIIIDTASQLLTVVVYTVLMYTTS